MKNLLYIGLDVHKDSISIAVAEPGRNGEIRSWGKITNSLHALDKVIRFRGPFFDHLGGAIVPEEFKPSAIQPVLCRARCRVVGRSGEIRRSSRSI